VSGADAFLQICGHGVDLLLNGVFHTTNTLPDLEGATLLFNNPVDGHPPSLSCWGDIDFALIQLGQLNLMERLPGPLLIDHTPCIVSLCYFELLHQALHCRSQLCLLFLRPRAALVSLVGTLLRRRPIQACPLPALRLNLSFPFCLVSAPFCLVSAPSLLSELGGEDGNTLCCRLLSLPRSSAIDLIRVPLKQSQAQIISMATIFCTLAYSLFPNVVW
jgi:hypothetical protein